MLNKIKKNIKIKFKSKIGVCLTLITIVSLFLLCFSFITKTNVIKVMSTRFLNSLGIYTEEIKEIDIYDSKYQEDGSWHIKEDVKWISKGSIEINLDLDTIVKQSDSNKDIILVLENSITMLGSKFDNMIDASKEVVNKILENPNNRVAIITYTNRGVIHSELTNDKVELINILDSLDLEIGATSYKAALENVVTVLEDYDKKDNTELTTVFITDGKPSLDFSGNIGNYAILKNLYPYIKINAIQYDTDVNTIFDEIKIISDKQWIADRKNISEIMFTAALTPISYDNFQLTYSLEDYFNISNISNIKVSNGVVDLSVVDGKQNVTWTLNKNTFLTGSSANLNIKAEMKNDSLNEENYYPVNNNIKVNMSIQNSSREKNDSTTPVLKSKYTIDYDVNTPDGCEIEDFSSDYYNAYSIIDKKNSELSCDGYLFKGWEIDSLNIKKLSDDQFVMPSKDINIRGTWAKQDIYKTMDGTVREKTTLYKVLKNEAETGTNAKEYTGKHQDTIDGSGKEKIYTFYNSSLYYSGEAVLELNNVIFADKCWQMFRTTDVGGVKLIYNGVPDINNTCGTDRENHEGISGMDYIAFYSSKYYFGTDYIYNESTGKYSLIGDLIYTTWSDENYQDLIGLYTCKSSSATGTCSPISKIDSYRNSYSANVVEYSADINYSVVGVGPYNLEAESLAHFGYKYGDPNDVNYFHVSDYNLFDSRTSLYYSSMSSVSSYWFSDEATYSTSTSKYTLTDAVQATADTDLSSLVGKYTLSSTSKTTTNSYLYYIVAYNADSGYLYYVRLRYGDFKDSIIDTYYYGDDITLGDDGLYTLTGGGTFNLSNWATDYESYNNKYICLSGAQSCRTPVYITYAYTTYFSSISASDFLVIGTGWENGSLINPIEVRIDLLCKEGKTTYANYTYTCNSNSSLCDITTVRYVHSYNDDNYTYASMKYFGNSISYDGEKYTLNNVIGPEYIADEEKLSEYRYVCPGIGETSCENVGYIFYHVIGNVYALLFRDGEMTYQDAINNMFTKNNNDSTIKKMVDDWYEKNLLSYQKYIDDVIYCNDRNISDYGRFASVGEIEGDVMFSGSTKPANIYCSSIYDSFSVSNPKAQLKYPVAIMSVPELTIMYGTKTQASGYASWTMTPHSFMYYDSLQPFYLYAAGGVGYDRRVFASGIRPVIALKKDVEYIDGNGSTTSPFIIDVG